MSGLPFDLQRDGCIRTRSFDRELRRGHTATYVAPSTETRVFSAEYEIGFDLVQAATLAEFQLSSKLLLVKLRVLPSGKVDYEGADYCGLATSLHATCINS